MTPEELKTRTRAFASAVVTFARRLPSDAVTLIMTRQLVRSGTGVGANYRSSCRAKSRADFISKMTTAEEEAGTSSSRRAGEPRVLAARSWLRLADTAPPPRASPAR